MLSSWVTPNNFTNLPKLSFEKPRCVRNFETYIKNFENKIKNNGQEQPHSMNKKKKTKTKKIINKLPKDVNTKYWAVWRKKLVQNLMLKNSFHFTFTSRNQLRNRFLISLLYFFSVL